MPRPDVISRARTYLANVPPAISGSGGHTHTLLTARALTRGFLLEPASAVALLAEWNAKCQPQWTGKELEHKVRSSATGPTPEKGDGYLLNGDEPEQGRNAAPPAPAPRPPKIEYDSEKLLRFAGSWNGKIDLVWLANRSVFDPATVTPDGFLRAIYRPGEHVYVAENDWGENDAIWPKEALSAGGKAGMKFLAQPIDAEWHPNPRTGKMSRRSRESVTSWRYLVLESDMAKARVWLAALAKLPLRISAIYSSGGKSIHALVRLDATTEAHWKDQRERLLEGIVVLGADRQSMSSVRLTRLPGFFREEKGRWQKLLYLNPEPQASPLISNLTRRDVEEMWWEFAAGLGAEGWPPAKVATALAAARYYERGSTRLQEMAGELSEIQEIYKTTENK